MSEEQIKQLKEDWKAANAAIQPQIDAYQEQLTHMIREPYLTLPMTDEAPAGYQFYGYTTEAKDEVVWQNITSKSDAEAPKVISEEETKDDEKPLDEQSPPTGPEAALEQTRGAPYEGGRKEPGMTTLGVRQSKSADPMIQTGSVDPGLPGASGSEVAGDGAAPRR